MATREQKWANTKNIERKDVNKALIGKKVYVFVNINRYEKDWKLATVTGTTSDTLVTANVGKVEKTVHFTDVKFV